MPDFPVISGDRFRGVTISTRDVALGIGSSIMAANGAALYASGTWPVANLAIFAPIIIPHPITVVKMGLANGAAVSGNADVGIYDFGGNRLVSAGSTAQAGTFTTQVFDVTDTKLAGGRYFIAVALDNVTGTTARHNLHQVALGGFGCLQMASAFPLPSTVTFAAMAQAYLPYAMLTARTVV